MRKTNIMLIGGFLGAGKTTSITAVAKYLVEEGKRIGIITNDQGSRLIDTEYLKFQGLDVLEVTGGCFCCNFNKFAERAYELSKKGDLDYILAEPVGSCTDLVATIMKPIKKGRFHNFNLLPLSVLVDPSRLLAEIISEKKNMPEEVEYLILKQIEEADIIVVNKIDILSRSDRKKIDLFLKERYSDKKVIYISAKKSIGIDSWMEETQKLGEHYDFNGKHSLDINYEKYAKAEAGLGWLNLESELIMQKKISGNYFVNSLADVMKKNLRSSRYEIAHMKIYLESDRSTCKLSCTSIYGENSIDKKIPEPIDKGRLLINIRANIDPVKLQEIVETALNIMLKESQGTSQNTKLECFSPSYPKPIYRY